MPVSYNEERQAICAVQLVPTQPNVFAAAIRHLLVVCTTTEVRRKFLAWAQAATHVHRRSRRRPWPMQYCRCAVDQYTLHFHVSM